MIFLAALPSVVFFTTCARSISPVAWSDGIRYKVVIRVRRCAHQVTHAVFVLDVWCLRSLSYKVMSQARGYGRERKSPAPGGPIKIMRIESTEGFGLEALSPCRATSS